MYAMRSARTCANCHVSPTLQDTKGWNNPKLSKRKFSHRQHCHRYIAQSEYSVDKVPTSESIPAV